MANRHNVYAALRGMDVSAGSATGGSPHIAPTSTTPVPGMVAAGAPAQHPQGEIAQVKGMAYDGAKYGVIQVVTGGLRAAGADAYSAIKTNFTK